MAEAPWGGPRGQVKQLGLGKGVLVGAKQLDTYTLNKLLLGLGFHIHLCIYNAQADKPPHMRNKTKLCALSTKKDQIFFKQNTFCFFTQKV